MYGRVLTLLSLQNYAPSESFHCEAHEYTPHRYCGLELTSSRSCRLNLLQFKITSTCHEDDNKRFLRLNCSCPNCCVFRHKRRVELDELSGRTSGRLGYIGPTRLRGYVGRTTLTSQITGRATARYRSSYAAMHAGPTTATDSRAEQLPS